MKKNNLLWGITFLLAAIAVIIGRVIPDLKVDVLGLVISIFMVTIIVRSLKPLNFGGILFPLAIIVIIYDEQLGLTAITPVPVLLAALLGSIGLGMLFGTHIHHDMSKHSNLHDYNTTVENDDASTVKCSANFGSTVKYINSEDFRQADINCSFGSLNVYLDKAVLNENGASIFLDVSFGSAELYIPSTWNVVINAKSSFGAVTEKNKSSYDDNSPKVTIDGRVSFGGVDIYYI